MSSVLTSSQPSPLAAVMASPWCSQSLPTIDVVGGGGLGDVEDRGCR